MEYNQKICPISCIKIRKTDMLTNDELINKKNINIETKYNPYNIKKFKTKTKSPIKKAEYINVFCAEINNEIYMFRTDFNLPSFNNFYKQWLDMLNIESYKPKITKPRKI